MATLAGEVTGGTFTRQQVQEAWEYHCNAARLRLNKLYDSSKEVLFDDHSRIVFFSDCHRGDRGRTDIFAGNEALFMHALQYYRHRGFAYVEVGDGNELYKHRMETVSKMYGKLFDLFHSFDRQGQLFLVKGNHDIEHGVTGKGCAGTQKDGISTDDGLLLRHIHTGNEIFVTHGHQVDIFSEQLRALGRLLVRYIWQPLQSLGITNSGGRYGHTPLCTKISRWVARYTMTHQLCIEQMLASWAKTFRRPILCGHTHLPRFSIQRSYGYFNTGSCTNPGILTGLELQNGLITPVKWFLGCGTAARREEMAPSGDLKLLGCG